MKKMLTENLWLKLVSIVIAAILWVLILYTYDPAATADFNLNVNIINGDTITSLGKVYEVIEGKTVTIRVKANSSLVKTLRSTDFEATADVSKLSPTSHAKIDVVCTRANNVDIRLIGTVKFLEVKLEDLTSKQFPITVEKRGEAGEGFFLGSAIPKPNFITVSGGKSTVNSIKTVRVRVDAKGASKSFNEKAVPKAYDANGDEITNGSLNFSEPQIAVSMNIFKTKNIPVQVKTIGHPYLGYGIESIDFEPKVIRVAGLDEKLSKIRVVVLPVEVNGAITSVESSIRLTDYIPDEIYLVEPETIVNINTRIVRLVTKDILIPFEKIKLLNQNEEWIYEKTSEEAVKVTVKGLKRDVDKLTEENLKPEIDFGSVTEAGEYRLGLKLAVVEGISLPPQIHLDFLVKEKEKEVETEGEADNSQGNSSLEENVGTGLETQEDKSEENKDLEDETLEGNERRE